MSRPCANYVMSKSKKDHKAKGKIDVVENGVPNSQFHWNNESPSPQEVSLMGQYHGTSDHCPKSESKHQKNDRCISTGPCDNVTHSYVDHSKVNGNGASVNVHSAVLNGVGENEIVPLSNSTDGLVCVNSFGRDGNGCRHQSEMGGAKFPNGCTRKKTSLKSDKANKDAETPEGKGSNSTSGSPKMSQQQAARPKTISWSRTVKHRRDQKEREKNKSRKQGTDRYIYPELCCSSDDSSDDASLFPKCKVSDQRQPLASSSSGSGFDEREYSEQLSEVHRSSDLISSPVAMVASPPLRLQQHSPGDRSGDIFVHTNGHASSSSDGNSSGNYNLAMPSCNLTLAPLAVPEDSDGSSVSTGSDSGPTNNQNTKANPQTGTSKTEGSQHTIKSSHKSVTIKSVEFVRFEEKIRTVETRRYVVQENVPVSHRSSSDSLEEIGDYIETDFPSRASRHMFASSSQSSSSSTEEDEGYGVNEEPRLPHEQEVEGASYLPSEHYYNPNNPSCQEEIQNSSSMDSHKSNDKLPCSKSSEIFVENHQSSSNSCSNSANKTSHSSRLDSYTGKSEDGSEGGGIIGSDSSVLYSPEVDFIEFGDLDLPNSLAASHAPVFHAGNDVSLMPPAEFDYSEFKQEPADLDGATGPSFLEQYSTNDLRGAEGGVTNDLNMDRHIQGFVFDDVESNMESFDPHLVIEENENFHYSDMCKHDKVPRANFQNSEGNRREKIFFKIALEKENDSSHSGSSDDEENLAYCMPREQLLNVGVGMDLERPPQNRDNSDCMVLEDLENLTHALRNAVIMPLPNKLEESSGDSSEEPIYEDIEYLEPVIPISKGDNLQVVNEEASSESISRMAPSFERRRRRCHRSHSDVEKVMIWNEYEAYVMQVKQIGTSACGPTAVLNVLKAFDFQVDKEEVCKKIITNTRMEAAPIPYYLFSRSSAGTTENSLIEGVQNLTRGTIKGRFFHFYPARKVQLLKWLGYWMKKGAVPIATLNLQRGVKPGWTIPDAWHHQMIYGVSSKGVYLTNPLEIVSEETVMEQLTSDSILLIRRQDVVNRFRDWAPLNDFLKQRDKHWQTMNVLGQVVNVLREACTALYQQGQRYRAQLTSHISIPAAYKAGITLFVRQNTEVALELFNAPELELKDNTE